MGIFDREKYSREGYEKAEKRADAAYNNARYRGTITGMSAEAKQRIYDELWSNSDKANARVENLHAKGRAEATALNEEYDRLRARAREAIEAVANFEKEKLGMHGESPHLSEREIKEKS